MERQLLVPLDGSPDAEQVLPHAIQLAQATASNLHLTQVVAPVISPPSLAWPSPAPVSVQRWVEAERAAAHRYLDDLALRLHGAGVQPRTSVAVGDPAAQILRLATEEAGIRMIAMATHGRGGVTRLRFGSVAKSVLPATPVPVLLVRVRPGGSEADRRPGMSAPRYQTILVPLDGSPFADEALPDAQRLARHSGAALVLTAVTEPATRPTLAGANAPHHHAIVAQQQIAAHVEATAARMRQIAITARTHVSVGDPAAMICEAASQEAADLIVMATHGRHGFQRFWLGSVALDVSAHTDLPVLLVRAEAAHAAGA